MFSCKTYKNQLINESEISYILKSVSNKIPNNSVVYNRMDNENYIRIYNMLISLKKTSYDDYKKLKKILSDEKGYSHFFNGKEPVYAIIYFNKNLKNSLKNKKIIQYDSMRNAIHNYTKYGIKMNFPSKIYEISLPTISNNGKYSIVYINSYILNKNYRKISDKLMFKKQKTYVLKKQKQKWIILDSIKKCPIK